MDEALALYEEALGVGPEHAKVLYNIGVLQSEKGNVSFLLIVRELIQHQARVFLPRSEPILLAQFTITKPPP